jgi:hypothetical protein
LGLCYTYGGPGAGDEHLIRVDLGLLEEVRHQSTVHLLSSKIVESKLNINNQINIINLGLILHEALLDFLAVGFTRIL